MLRVQSAFPPAPALLLVPLLLLVVPLVSQVSSPPVRDYLRDVTAVEGSLSNYLVSHVSSPPVSAQAAVSSCWQLAHSGRTYGRHYAGERVNTSRYAGEHGNIEPGAAGPYHRAALADVARERPRLALRIVLQRLALQRGL